MPDARGSQWRKWDLHVHTPASANTQFGDPREDATWARFAHALFEAKTAHGIAAVCLSDYFTFDGYRQLLDRGIYDPAACRWHSEAGSCELAVLPGVELRLSNITLDDNAVNLHVILDPSRLTVERLTEDFLANLPLDPHHGQQVLRATKAHILALGKATLHGVAPNLNERLIELPPSEQQGLWNAGLGAASVSIDSLMKTLAELDESLLGGRAYLLAFANSGYGGLHEFPWVGHAATIRQDLPRKADLLFSSNASDRNFLLGRIESTPPREFITRFGRLKPCVWGSDSKSLDTLLHPSSGSTLRYTWIKADTTFDGLKQLVYEPEDRVAVQELQPDLRPWNTLIDSVRFLDSAKKDLVSEAWHPLSEGLTAVIGGKSSGKSLLLHLIAKTVDPTQVKERAGTGRNPYARIEQDVGFEVRWKNGDIQSLGGAEMAPSRITYLPQSYINRLAEPESEEQLADVILHLLREDAAFAEADRRLRREIDQQTSVVGGELQKVFDLRRQIAESADRIEGLGKETAIEAEIARLKAEQADILKSSGLTIQEENANSELREHLGELDSQRQNYLLAMSTLVEGSESLGALRDRIVGELDALVVAPAGDAVENSSHKVFAKTITVLADVVDTGFAVALGALATEREGLQVAVTSAVVESAATNECIEPFRAKIEGRERAQAAADAEGKQRQLLDEIREEIQRRDRLKARQEDSISRTITAYSGVHEAYHRFVQQKLSGGSLDIARDVRLLASIGFDEVSFWRTFLEGLDGRQRLSEFHGYTEAEDRYAFPGLDVHCRDVERALRNLAGPEADRKLKIRRAYKPDTIAAALLRDHFKLAVSLVHEGDDLQRMSPGKRGMVLLRLLLEKSDATHPILIDQPEDNLDNRTVFSQLRQAVRNRKRLRQIVVVSHNANLVVSTDAECVLVAHQYGSGETPQGVPRFEYVGGALEDSRTAQQLPSVLARQGIREHVCEVLEGGEQAFRDRQEKYEFSVA